MARQKWNHWPLITWICLIQSLSLVFVQLWYEDADGLFLLIGFSWLILTPLLWAITVLNRQKWGKRAWSAVIVHSATPFLIGGLSETEASEWIAWQRRSSTLQGAAARIVKLNPPDGYFKLAPDAQWVLHPSQEGEVEIKRYNGDFTILFVTGLTDFSGDLGWLYSQRDIAPKGPLQQRDYLEAGARKKAHWFRCYSPNGWD